MSRKKDDDDRCEHLKIGKSDPSWHDCLQTGQECHDFKTNIDTITNLRTSEITDNTSVTSFSYDRSGDVQIFPDSSNVNPSDVQPVSQPTVQEVSIPGPLKKPPLLLLYILLNHLLKMYQLSSLAFRRNQFQILLRSSPLLEFQRILSPSCEVCRYSF